MEQETLSVLVVEDEPNVRLVATTYIEDLGFKVYEAEDADEALFALKEHPDINLIFTDIWMPGTMNGANLVDQISKEYPKIEIIVTSGRDVWDGFSLPEYGTFLPKPYQPSRLKALIEAKLIANGF